MIDHPDSVDKALDELHKELKKAEVPFCDKCKPLFHRFIKRWFKNPSER